MRGRSDEARKNTLVIALVVGAIFLGFLYVYRDSIFGSQSGGAGALEYGSKSLRILGWGRDDDADETSFEFSEKEGENGVVPRSFPVSLSLRWLCMLMQKGSFILRILDYFVCTFFYAFAVVPKVCDDRHSELIPCLDRHLIYQLRLKLDLSLMEHYERHCPPQERRYNCLIPPPPGYKVRLMFFVLKAQKYIVWYPGYCSGI